MQLEQPQAIRTIFFDVGLTLLYAYPSDLEICLQVCQRLGFHLTEEELVKQGARAEDFFLRHMRANRYVWASDVSIREFWIMYYMEMLQPLMIEHGEKHLRNLARTIAYEYDKHTSWQMYPDVLPTLQALHASKKYTLGAISDWSHSLGPIFQRLNLNKYFDCLLISSVTGHAKPSALLYETALERANSVADYAIHIGDSYTQDVLGARAAGMIPILLDRKRQVRPEQIDCLLIHSLSDLLPLLEIDG
ncbi:MAG TPA: HAD family hydrolase [Ktedonobacteraceae bacterium]|nr:HAD family hydrolase [Ktedonobacteraceae bacterium]